MFDRLRDSLSRTRDAFRKVGGIFRSGKPREEMLDDLAEALILADVGLATVDRVVAALRDRSRKDAGYEDLLALLKEELTALLDGRSATPVRLPSPGVVLAVGVNGGGKTTTLAKLARRYRTAGRTVMLAAADTFRAAAQEQLEIWGRRIGAPVVRGAYGADPASVVFDALRSFKAQGLDVLLVDTAGRVHTRANLMAELEKIRRVIGREIPGAPHEALLVLDASVGQNAVAQAREFLKVSGLTGIALTKLDGTAKGGAAIGIAAELGLPIRYLGVGEGEDDLEDFSAREFVEALLS